MPTTRRINLFIYQDWKVDQIKKFLNSTIQLVQSHKTQPKSGFVFTFRR
jgi:hypothetical protein